MSGSEDGVLDRYFQAISDEGIYPNQENLRLYLDYLFDSVSLRQKSLLEIGGGSGWLSLYARCRGAARVVCLEPEAAGSSPLAALQFDHLADRIGVQGVERVPARVQNFTADGARFDLILLHNSINHLDEEACITLLRDDGALKRYRAILDKIGRLSEIGATLIAVDCSRYNFFGMLGITNPVARTINWEKHQSPWTWARLVEEVGFGRPGIRWASFNRLGKAGRLLLGNRVASFFLTSQFCLTMVKTLDVRTISRHGIPSRPAATR